MFGGGFRKNSPIGPGGRRKKRGSKTSGKVIQKATVKGRDLKDPKARIVPIVKSTVVQPAGLGAPKARTTSVISAIVQSAKSSRLEGRPRAGTPSDPPVGRHERSGIAIIGRFSAWEWGQHPDEAYMADALEQLGEKVYRVEQEANTFPPRNALQAEWALFTGNPKSFNHMEDWRRTHPTALWTLDWLPGYSDRINIIQAGKRATLFLTSDQYRWGAHGIGNHVYLPGACETQVAVFRPKPTTPCAFVGSLYSERRKKIAQIVRSKGGTVLDSPSSWIYGEKLSRFLQTVKVTVGDNAVNNVPGYWSTRNYIIPGAGGFLLTPRVPDLDMHFMIGKELAVYDAVETLPGELDRWISNDAEREVVRRAGFDRARKDHSWLERARMLRLTLAGRYIGS